MGFHVIDLTDISYHFLTASHCTENFGGSTGKVFYQPTVSAINRVGVESVNPAWSTSGCLPLVVFCRLSDVAMVKFDTISLASNGVGQSSVVGTGNSAGNLYLGAV